MSRFLLACTILSCATATLFIRPLDAADALPPTASTQPTPLAILLSHPVRRTHAAPALDVLPAARTDTQARAVAAPADRSSSSGGEPVSTTRTTRDSPAAAGNPQESGPATSNTARSAPVSATRSTRDSPAAASNPQESGPVTPVPAEALSRDAPARR
jgi:hypothetical protein